MRGRFSCIIACAASFLAVPSVAYAENLLPLDDAYEPVAQWSLSARADHCAITRRFTKDGDEAVLSIRKAWPGGSAQFAVAADSMGGVRIPIKAGFAPSSKMDEFREVAPAAIGGKPAIVFAGSLLRKATANESVAEDTVDGEVTHFVITGASKEPIVLHTYAMEKARTALDNCVDEMLGKALQVLPSEQSELASHASPVKQEEWAQKIMANYPSEMIRQGIEGTVRVGLIIDKNGRVSHCFPKDQMAAKGLRDAACGTLIEYARFRPARDAKGEAMPHLWSTQIIYDMQSMNVDAHGMLVRD